MALGNNCVAFIFDEFRYELNGLEIDHNINVSITSKSSLKNYVTVSSDRSADVHWLMLTDVKHIKKSVLCAQGSFVRSLIHLWANSGFKLIPGIYYMGWKVLGFLMKTSIFWAKLYLFLNIVAFEGDILGIAIFQHFNALSSTKCPSLRNTPRFPRWLPYSMWISFPEATAWGLGTDNSRWGRLLSSFHVWRCIIVMVQNEGESSAT